MARGTAVLCLHQEETGLKSGVRPALHPPPPKPTPPATVVCDPIQHGGRRLHGTFAHFSTWVSAHYPLSDSLYPLHINFACQPAPAVFYFHASRNFGSCNSVPPLNLTRPSIMTQNLSRGILAAHLVFSLVFTTKIEFQKTNRGPRQRRLRFANVNYSYFRFSGH